MKQNNNSFKTKEMKKIFDILFKDKEPEEQLEINDWYKHINNSLQRN